MIRDGSNDNVDMPSKRFGRGLWFLTAGELIQLIGDHTLTVAISAYTYGMTGSTWGFALQQLVIFAPWLLFSALAGPLVDRLDRRKVTIVAETIRGLSCLAFPLCRSLEPILLLNFIVSTCRVFGKTARTALIPSLCPKNTLLRVNGIRTSLFGMADLVIPTLAGVVIAKVGAASSFPFTTFASIVAASMCALIAPRAGSSGVGSKHRFALAGSRERALGSGHRRALREAAAFIKADKGLLGLIVLYCAYATGQNGVNAIFYPFVDSVLHAGPQVFGLSVSLYFGSNLAAGFLLARFPNVVRRIPPAALAMPPMMSWVMHSFVRKVPIILGLGVVEGLSFSILTNLLMTEVQSRAPADMTGSVWGLTQTLTTGCELLGIVFAGAVGERLGPAMAYRTMGLGSLLVLGAVVILSRSLRRGHQRYPVEVE